MSLYHHHSSGVPGNRHKAFTLIELSLVLLIVSLLAAAALRYSTASSDTRNINSLNASLDAIDTALLQYRATYGRLPCPADITAAENTASFGAEVDTTAIGSGKCTSANFLSGNLAAGSIPTKTLRLADKYAYDSWGRKILYGADIRMTATDAFVTYPIYSTTPGAITVTNSASSPVTLTSSAIYILVSSGKNGHGGFTRNLSTACTLSTCPIFNAGSTNTDEQKNCHCNSSAVATAFGTTFVQDTPNITNGGANNTVFDDIVRYKTRAQMATTAELQ